MALAACAGRRGRGCVNWGAGPDGQGDHARMDPIVDARDLVAARFPEARCAFLGPGILSARRTATSDLDIVVLLGGPPAPFRESLIWRDWPAELFVHDLNSIGTWLASEAAKRKPSLARMCADGVILGDAGGTAGAVRDQARAMLAAGPLPLGPAERDRLRYGLSDLLDDLMGSTDQGETAVICWYVLEQTAELALLLAGSWLGRGKWLLRELRAADPALADELIAARADPARLTALADDVLARAGGRLWAGYRASGDVG